MLVCDCCKVVSKPARPCFVALLKVEEKKGREVERAAKRFPLHLCEDCITKAIACIGKALNGLGT